MPLALALVKLLLIIKTTKPTFVDLMVLILTL